MCVSVQSRLSDVLPDDVSAHVRRSDWAGGRKLIPCTYYLTVYKKGAFDIDMFDMSSGTAPSRTEYDQLEDHLYSTFHHILSERYEMRQDFTPVLNPIGSVDHLTMYESEMEEVMGGLLSSLGVEYKYLNVVVMSSGVNPTAHLYVGGSGMASLNGAMRVEVVMGKDGFDNTAEKLKSLVRNSVKRERRLWTPRPPSKSLVQDNPYRTDNPIGWGHCYLAHLVVNCKMSQVEASRAAMRSLAFANDPDRPDKSYLSDNECIMQSHPEWAEKLRQVFRAPTYSYVFYWKAVV